MIYALWALSIMNVLGFFIAALDKHKARKRKWRISEATFFIIAFLGGSLGIYVSMLLFRHKTRHWYFMVGMPLILLFQLILLYFMAGPSRLF